jgi:hypothetical protein
MIHAYYRISDKNRRGKAPEYFTNENCLRNFIKNFTLYDSDKLTVIADNIGEETEAFLKSLNLNYIKTSLGNSGSFDFALKDAMKNCKEQDIVYFIENDYLHRAGSREAIDEAFSVLNSDYVSLYDAPEKYENHYNINYKKFVDFSGNIFTDYKSKIYSGINNFWRSSNSFTMTFAMKCDLIRHDYEVFKYELLEMDREGYPYKSIPRDFELFKILSEIKNRKLITPMPGYATHGDILSPHIDWFKVYNG